MQSDGMVGGDLLDRLAVSGDNEVGRRPRGLTRDILRPMIASMATLALNSGLWVRRLLNSCGEGCAYGESTFQGRCPA